MTVKTLIMLQKVSISNKCCSFELCLIKLNSSLANFDSDTPNFQNTREFMSHSKKKKTLRESLNRIKNTLKLPGWRLTSHKHIMSSFFGSGDFRLRAPSGNSRSSTPKAQIEAASCGSSHITSCSQSSSDRLAPACL